MAEFELPFTKNGFKWLCIALPHIMILHALIYWYSPILLIDQYQFQTEIILGIILCCAAWFMQLWSWNKTGKLIISFKKPFDSEDRNEVSY